jgi:rare lipoprotein A
MNGRLAIVISSALLLAACASTPHRKDASQQAEKATTPGGYLAGDGPGDNVPANIDSIPDAIPKDDQLHPYANRPYIALGKTYTPLTVTGNYKQRGIASWYGKKFNGGHTSSGEIYDMYGMTAAHPVLPIPSYARVTNLSNQKSVIVRINDRGPFMNDLIIDLSYTAAHKLGIIGNGSSEVEVESITPGVSINAIAGNTVQSQPLLGSGLVATSSPTAGPALVSAPNIAADPPGASGAPHAPVADPAGAPPEHSEPLANNDAGYYLQLGAFSSKESAEAYRQKMRNELGDSVKEIKLTSKDGLVRVCIGPYANLNEARNTANALESKLHFKPVVNLP